MNSKKKILLISCTGQVGAELLRGLQPLGEVIPADQNLTTVTRLDLTNEKQIREVIQQVKPNIIVNAAAYTAVDKAEQDQKTAMAINGTALEILADLAKQTQALLVHYSTDYVFDGTKNAPYLETDTPNPLNMYGKSKLAGDQAIQASGCNHLIFRTSWVYGRYGQNFFLTIQRLAKEREELRIVADQIGAPTWSRLIAEMTVQVLSQLYSPRFQTDLSEISGIYNLTCGGQTNWCEFAQRISERAPKPPRVIPIPTADYPAPAKRPLYSVLSNEKLAQTFGLELPDWQEALNICLSRTTLA
jgi:dTDP-4-dehydrorhamnose reductase